MEVIRPVDPLFPFQAVDAAKAELIPQPFSILHGGRIPLPAVSATVSVGRILESVHASHGADFC